MTIGVEGPLIHYVTIWPDVPVGFIPLRVIGVIDATVPPVDVPLLPCAVVVEEGPPPPPNVPCEVVVEEGPPPLMDISIFEYAGIAPPFLRGAIYPPGHPFRENPPEPPNDVPTEEHGGPAAAPLQGAYGGPDLNPVLEEDEPVIVYEFIDLVSDDEA